MTPTVNDLLEQAAQKAGLADFGDDWFLGPLTAYMADLNADHLSEWGRAFLTRLALKDLIRRLQIIDCLKQNPEIEATPIPPILYVTGHERSGTTMLHNLLAAHGSARCLSRWELMMPTPPPEAASFAEDSRRAQVQKSVDALRGSDLESMHWVDAGDPEECPWGFMDCTGLLGMAPGLIMPRWNAWLANNDLGPTLVNYRKVIQLLTWRNPVPEGGFLVLKAPQMATHLAAFSREFPEAKFLYIHRDPYRVLLSFCTLIEIVDGPFLQDADFLARQERDKSAILKRMATLFAKLGEFEDARPDLVQSVQYMDLIASPAAQIRRIFEQFGFATDSSLIQSIEQLLARQKAGARAKPRQQLSDFGYTRQDVGSDVRIASYLKRYSVVLESRRQTGS